MAADRQRNFYLAALAHWPRCAWDMGKKGQEVTERVMFWLGIGGLALWALGLLTPKEAPASTASTAAPGATVHWVVVISILLVLLAPLLVAMRKEHEERLAASRKKADEELSGYASANLGLRERLRAAECQREKAAAELARLSDTGPLDEIAAELRLVPLGLKDGWMSNAFEMFAEFGSAFATEGNEMILADCIVRKHTATASGDAHALASYLISQWSLRELLEPVAARPHSTRFDFGLPGGHKLSPVGKRLWRRFGSGTQMREDA